MKKMIALIMLLMVAFGIFAVPTFAATWHNEYWDFSVDYYRVKDNAFYAYYHVKEPNANQCWVSTEVSVSLDMYAEAYAKITGVNNETKTTYNEGNNGTNWLKTTAAIVNVEYAKETFHYGIREVGSSLVGDWFDYYHSGKYSF